MLTLRPCRIGGQTAPDDHSVLDDGELIGRTRKATERVLTRYPQGRVIPQVR